MLKIEKNIPIPQPIRGKKYPFDMMDIGDSFFVECNENKEDKKRKISTVLVAALRFRPKKFTTRSSGIKNGIRCWRIE
jgi:hypothetical protein